MREGYRYLVTLEDRIGRHRQQPEESNAMLCLPTALLLHTTEQGCHYDWLMGDPTDPKGRLWTARVNHPAELWPTLGSLNLTVLPAHRRHYLTYQGPVAPRRGQVRRVDQGWHTPLRWTGRDILTAVCFEHTRMTLHLTAQSRNRWRAIVLESPRSYNKTDFFAR